MLKLKSLAWPRARLLNLAATPVFAVSKKNGAVRVVVNLKKKTQQGLGWSLALGKCKTKSQDRPGPTIQWDQRRQQILSDARSFQRPLANSTSTKLPLCGSATILPNTHDFKRMVARVRLNIMGKWNKEDIYTKSQYKIGVRSIKSSVDGGWSSFERKLEREDGNDAQVRLCVSGVARKSWWWAVGHSVMGICSCWTRRAKKPLTIEVAGEMRMPCLWNLRGCIYYFGGSRRHPHPCLAVPSDWPKKLKLFVIWLLATTSASQWHQDGLLAVLVFDPKEGSMNRNEIWIGIEAKWF